MQLREELFEKYNVSGPRYTSYPTAVQFSELNNSEADAYLTTYNSSPRQLSLYVHLPFCQTQCFYCGCTTVITKKNSRSEEYLSYLKREISKEANRSHPETKVHQLHYGGGTPTFFSPSELKELTLFIMSKFNFANDAECSIELDPRTVTEEHVHVLREVGFNRASLGVQDVNEDVQIAINRVQPMEQNIKLMNLLRENGFNSVNIDLIYGLPKQTPERFEKTLAAIEILQPDRIALYSYAHVPWVKKNQRMLDESELPSANEKLAMLTNSISVLSAQNWEYIGMDHFARPWDELSKARKTNDLHRNFQGFSTKAGLDMMAFGMSGIAQMGTAYLQRPKDLRSWKSSIAAAEGTFVKGYFLSKDDVIRKDMIMQIMCSGNIKWAEFGIIHQIDAEHYFSDTLEKLAELEADGLVINGKNGFIVTLLGRLFLRNIAMMFDAYLPKGVNQSIYSKTI